MASGRSPKEDATPLAFRRAQTVGKEEQPPSETPTRATWPGRGGRMTCHKTLESKTPGAGGGKNPGLSHETPGFSNRGTAFTDVLERRTVSNAGGPIKAWWRNFTGTKGDVKSTSRQGRVPKKPIKKKKKKQNSLEN